MGLKKLKGADYSPSPIIHANHSRKFTNKNDLFAIKPKLFHENGGNIMPK